jgi:hypothetical protein
MIKIKFFNAQNNTLLTFNKSLAKVCNVLLQKSEILAVSFLILLLLVTSWNPWFTCWGCLNARPDRVYFRQQDSCF